MLSKLGGYWQACPALCCLTICDDWWVQARLIVVYASSGRTASLVAKYRPQMPILTLVVPSLKSTALGWQMQGRCLARQLLCMRGERPV